MQRLLVGFSAGLFSTGLSASDDLVDCHFRKLLAVTSFPAIANFGLVLHDGYFFRLAVVHDRGLYFRIQYVRRPDLDFLAAKQEHVRKNDLALVVSEFFDRKRLAFFHFILLPPGSNDCKHASRFNDDAYAV